MDLTYFHLYEKNNPHKKNLKLSGGIWNIIHLFKQISSDEAKEKNVMD